MLGGEFVAHRAGALGVSPLRGAGLLRCASSDRPPPARGQERGETYESHDNRSGWACRSAARGFDRLSPNGGVVMRLEILNGHGPCLFICR